MFTGCFPDYRLVREVHIRLLHTGSRAFYGFFTWPQGRCFSSANPFTITFVRPVQSNSGNFWGGGGGEVANAIVQITNKNLAKAIISLLPNLPPDHAILHIHRTGHNV